MDFLKRRGWNFANRCFLCKMEEESATHLVLGCRVTLAVWDYFKSTANYYWINPPKIDQAMDSWPINWKSKRVEDLGLHSDCYMVDVVEGRKELLGL